VDISVLTGLTYVDTASEKSLKKSGSKNIHKSEENKNVTRYSSRHTKHDEKC
jgi:hypothetical protein